MKRTQLIVAVVAATAFLVLASGFGVAQKPAEKPAEKPKQPPQEQGQAWLVAFRTTGEPPRYITSPPMGALDASGRKITAKQIYTMLDINGGNLAHGDPVKLRWEASIWREDKAAGKVHRIAFRGAPEAECTFKIRVKGQHISLETPSGKFVSAPAGGGPLVTTDKQDDTTMFTALPNPTPEPPPSPKPTPTPTPKQP